MGGDDDTIANRTRSKKRLRRHSQGIVNKLLPVLPEEIIVEIILQLLVRSLLQFTLWNPSINFESKTSPSFVCFNHNFSTYCGFGFDQVNDRYKVLVVVRNWNNLRESVTMVYTFGEIIIDEIMGLSPQILKAPILSLSGNAISESEIGNFIAKALYPFRIYKELI
ncbi:hypothetical protein MTR_4g108790 [Medicago truncatula]|uniref:F-box domain-containing protein n=1 Tax=Medicago truncatula TaxID=3880 RepID=A0A072UQ56_MEDTR|nr:hypothetical protein MTR_4g108790 [Medicago truncatula]